MEKWQYDLDRWLTTPPEDLKSQFFCEHCKEPFYPGDKVYKIEDENLCPECAGAWLENQWEYATEDDCY